MPNDPKVVVLKFGGVRAEPAPSTTHQNLSGDSAPNENDTLETLTQLNQDFLTLKHDLFELIYGKDSIPQDLRTRHVSDIQNDFKNQYKKSVEQLTTYYEAHALALIENRELDKLKTLKSEFEKEKQALKQKEEQIDSINKRYQALNVGLNQIQQSDSNQYKFAEIRGIVQTIETHVDFLAKENLNWTRKVESLISEVQDYFNSVADAYEKYLKNKWEESQKKFDELIKAKGDVSSLVACMEKILASIDEVEKLKKFKEKTHDEKLKQALESIIVGKLTEYELHIQKNFDSFIKRLQVIQKQNTLEKSIQLFLRILNNINIRDHRASKEAKNKLFKSLNLDSTLSEETKKYLEGLTFKTIFLYFMVRPLLLSNQNEILEFGENQSIANENDINKFKLSLDEKIQACEELIKKIKTNTKTFNVSFSASCHYLYWEHVVFLLEERYVRPTLTDSKAIDNQEKELSTYDELEKYKILALRIKQLDFSEKGKQKALHGRLENILKLIKQKQRELHELNLSGSPSTSSGNESTNPGIPSKPNPSPELVEGGEEKLPEFPPTSSRSPSTSPEFPSKPNPPPELVEGGEEERSRFPSTGSGNESTNPGTPPPSPGIASKPNPPPELVEGGEKKSPEFPPTSSRSPSTSPEFPSTGSGTPSTSPGNESTNPEFSSRVSPVETNYQAINPINSAVPSRSTVKSMQFEKNDSGRYVVKNFETEIKEIRPSAITEIELKVEVANDFDEYDNNKEKTAVNLTITSDQEKPDTYEAVLKTPGKEPGLLGKFSMAVLTLLNALNQVNEGCDPGKKRALEIDEIKTDDPEIAAAFAYAISLINQAKTRSIVSKDSEGFDIKPKSCEVGKFLKEREDNIKNIQENILGKMKLKDVISNIQEKLPFPNIMKEQVIGPALQTSTSMEVEDTTQKKRILEFKGLPHIASRQLNSPVVINRGNSGRILKADDDKAIKIPLRPDDSGFYTELKNNMIISERVQSFEKICSDFKIDLKIEHLLTSEIIELKVNKLKQKDETTKDYAAENFSYDGFAIENQLLAGTLDTLILNNDVTDDTERQAKILLRFVQMTSAMLEAHALRLIHRDNALRNFGEYSDEKGSHVKLMDFDLSRFVDSNHNKRGTLTYKIPFDLASSTSVQYQYDPLSDLHGMAVAMIQLLSITAGKDIDYYITNAHAITVKEHADTILSKQSTTKEALLPSLTLFNQEMNNENENRSQYLKELAENFYSLIENYDTTSEQKESNIPQSYEKNLILYGEFFQKELQNLVLQNKSDNNDTILKIINQIEETLSRNKFLTWIVVSLLTYVQENPEASEDDAYETLLRNALSHNKANQPESDARRPFDGTNDNLKGPGFFSTGNVDSALPVENDTSVPSKPLRGAQNP